MRDTMTPFNPHENERKVPDMKMKTMAMISGKLLAISSGSMMLIPTFDHSARIQILIPDRDVKKYELLQPGDDVIVQGEIALYDSRRVSIIPDRITRQVKGEYRDVNLVAITARSKSVSYSLKTDDLFHAEFESGIIGITRVNFSIDRTKLNPEALRDFALGNQYRPYCISGRLASNHNKLQLVAESITRA